MNASLTIIRTYRCNNSVGVVYELRGRRCSTLIDTAWPDDLETVEEDLREDLGAAAEATNREVVDALIADANERARTSDLSVGTQRMWIAYTSEHYPSTILGVVPTRDQVVAAMRQLLALLGEEPFLARYQGRCEYSGRVINVGDLIYNPFGAMLADLVS